MAFFTVTGSWQKPDGTPSRGHVKVIPIAQQSVADGLIFPDASQTFKISTTGTLDQALEDNGVGYHIEVHVSRATVVKADIPCNDVDLSTLVLPTTPIDVNTLGIMPSVQIAGTTWTPDVSHVGRRVEFTNVAGCLITLPARATVPWPDDGGMTCDKYGGDLTFQGDVGVTVNAPYGLVSTGTTGAGFDVRKRRQSVAPDEWTIQQ